MAARRFRRQESKIPVVRNSIALATLMLCVMLFAFGCGSDRGLVPVSGTVTFDGGPMPGNGHLRFVPLKVAEGFARRPGMAKFTENGKFRVRSFEPGDGLFPGEYAVFPYCWEVEAVMGGPPAKSFLPARYGDAGNPPFRLTVEADQRSIRFDVATKSSE